MMGVAKRGAGDLKGAVEDLKQAVALDPDLPGVHGLYAQALLESGNPDLARREFEAELSRNPLDFDANLNMGVLLKTEQDYDAALVHLTRALGVRPGDLPTRYQIASVALARRDTATATDMLEADRQGGAVVRRGACRARDGILPPAAQGRRRSRAGDRRAAEPGERSQGTRANAAPKRSPG